MQLSTERLLLRPWRPDDLDPFAALNADPRVMEFFPSVLSRHESDALANRIAATHRRARLGPLGRRDFRRRPFAGYIGLAVPRFESQFTPCVEIGWRLAKEHWGQGYAIEGARAALAFGFTALKLDEIVSFTVPANLRSRRVMERLGMTRSEADDFDHPGLPVEHPLRRHVLYRIHPRPEGSAR